MKAKEYFEGIRAEVVKTDRAREMLERMRAREGARRRAIRRAAAAGMRQTLWIPSQGASTSRGG